MSLVNIRFCILFFLVSGIRVASAQVPEITLSGTVKSSSEKKGIPYLNVLVLKEQDSSFVAGTVTDSLGFYTVKAAIPPGNYRIKVSGVGYVSARVPIYIGSLNSFYTIPPIFLQSNLKQLDAITITGNPDERPADQSYVQVYKVTEQITQSGGSVAQMLQNLPGITQQDGKIQLRGNDRIIVLINGKQSGLTGMGSQSGLDNFPVSAIERIEIIHQPGSAYDANGTAGIINIILKKGTKAGWNGKVGLSTGLGALWIRKPNLPGIRPQYFCTPKVNPSVFLNYRSEKWNVFLQADNLLTYTLNKNEFTTRTYDDGTIIQQQLKRNRMTNFFSGRAGFDYTPDEQNSVALSASYGSEKILDRGDEPFFTSNLSQRLRLWQFLEDELKTTITGQFAWKHRFKDPGHVLNLTAGYSYHRENEKYYFDNIMPTFQGNDAFKLLSDEHVVDISADYTKPLKYGRIETGLKVRYRIIPTNMQFFPGLNSPLDSTAGGPATYDEWIPAVYSNYVFENKKWEAEIGLRLEFAKVSYTVRPGHPVYKSGSYTYIQPFPTFRIAHKINDQHKLYLYGSRRVDRPNEVDIRVFPKYDDAEIIKVGNPYLKPQFTEILEFGYSGKQKKYSYSLAAYGRLSDATITRISTVVPGSTIIYAVFQNAGRSYNAGLEGIFTAEPLPFYQIVFSGNLWYNQINSFSVVNLYPVPTPYASPTQKIISGTIKVNQSFKLRKDWSLQLTVAWLAPDIIPQGRIDKRFSIDTGFKKLIQRKKGEITFNMTDLLNTLVIHKTIQGNGFRYTSADYYETQAFRIGYMYSF